MAGTLASLRILLGLDAAGVRSGSQTAIRELQGVQASARNTQQALGSLQRIGLAAGGALFASTAANLLELDTAVRKYSADVGATADEAKRAQAATTELFRSNVQGFDEILATMAKLRTDQGQTQEGAEALTEQYLRFARVAGGDGAAAVESFDDVLDAFNLSASDAVGVMDALVASNQKFGGSLQQRVTDLARLAPALQGLNLGIEDAIALENLFEASGLNAADAMRALNTAVANLKPGQTFDDLIRQISGIENPTLRAQAAIDIFGVRGGTVLAQALRPGIDSLDDFGVSASDAAGKTDAAARQIDGSVPKQFELFLHNFQSTLADLAGPAGPILLTAASVAQLAAAFGGLRLAAIGGWLATLGPAALAGGAVVGFLLLLKDNIDAAAEAAMKNAVATGDMTAEIEAARVAAENGTGSWEAYDILVDRNAANQKLLASRVAESTAQVSENADALMFGAGAADDHAEAVGDMTGALAAADRYLINAGDMALLTGQKFGTGALGVGQMTDALHAFNVEASRDVNLNAVSESDRGLTDTPGRTSRQDFIELTSGVRSGAASGAAAARSRAAQEAAEHARKMRDDLVRAYDDMKRAAKEHFDFVHDANLRAIDDARDRKNAELDAQKAANLAPVTEAEAALRAIQEQRRLAALQAELANAETPEEKLAAEQALSDFLKQSQIDQMRLNANAANSALDDEQRKNDAIAADAIDAENERYNAQLRAFEKDERALKSHLDNAKDHWKDFFKEIADLAAEYGVGGLVGVSPQKPGGSGREMPNTSAGITPSFGRFSEGRSADMAGISAGLAPIEITLISQTILDGEVITQSVERRQYRNASAVTSGFIAKG